MPKRLAGCAALRLMDSHLAANALFCGAAPTLADIDLFASTHVADVGGFGLGDYPHVQAWIALVQALPAYVPMELCLCIDAKPSQL